MVAHPDDEVLGCGALVATLSDVRVVQVTNGAPRDETHAAQAGFATRADYAAARRAESLAALAVAGVPASRLTNLGIDDQAVPAHLVRLARRLGRFVGAADIVLTHAYEGGHGDHDAVAFAVHAAVRLRPAARRPALLEMPFYFADADGWARQRFLPRDRWGVPACHDRDTIVRVLSPADRARKSRMIGAHASQAGTLAPFPIAAERFRPAPPYDFRTRPHDGDLLYERHGWSLTWAAWEAAVGQAMTVLGLP